MPAHLDRAAMAELVDQLGGRLTAAVSELHGLVVNNCLATETVVLPASGQVSRQWRVPFGSLSLSNNAPGTLTATTGPAEGKAPAQGPGVAKVSGYGFAVVNMAGRDLTLYGTPGAVIVLSVFATPQPPAAGSITPASVPVPLAAGQAVNGPGRLTGLAVSETTGAAGARVNLRDGTSAVAPLIVPISLAANESIRDELGAGFSFTTGLFVEVVNGSVNGSVFVAGGSVA